MRHMKNKACIGRHIIQINFVQLTEKELSEAIFSSEYNQCHKSDSVLLPGCVQRWNRDGLRLGLMFGSFYENTQIYT